MFEDCTIKYQKKIKLDDDGNLDGYINTCIRIIYPTKDDGSTFSKAVPIAEDNTDYQNILEWVAEGNTIGEAD